MKTLAFCLLLTAGLHFAIEAQDVQIKGVLNTTNILLIPDGNDDGGEIKLFAPNGVNTLDMGGNSEGLQGAYINMFRADGIRTIHLDAHHFGGGEFYLNNTTGAHGIHMMGNSGTGIISNDASVDMYDISGVRRLRLSAGDGLFAASYLTIFNSAALNTAIFGDNVVGGGEMRLRSDEGVDIVVAVANPGADIYHLRVDGKIVSEELRILDSSNWPDYVFDTGYTLRTLDEFGASIRQNGHLPGIPSAREMALNGIDVGDIQKRQMEKIEELSLYILQLHNRLIALEQKF